MNFSESENVQYLDVIIKFEVYLPYKEPSTYAIFYMCMYILLFINIIARNVLYFCIHVRIQKMCPDPTPFDLRMCMEWYGLHRECMKRKKNKRTGYTSPAFH